MAVIALLCVPTLTKCMVDFDMTVLRVFHRNKKGMVINFKMGIYYLSAICFLERRFVLMTRLFV